MKINKSHNPLLEFKNACVNGDLEKAKTIWYSSKNLDVSLKDLTRAICKRGHTHVFKWLLQINPEYCIREGNDNLFKAACGHGHLELVQLLFCIDPKINIESDYYKALSLATAYGHLGVLKYLFDEHLSKLQDSDPDLINDITGDLIEIANENQANQISNYLTSKLDSTKVNLTPEEICLTDSVKLFGSLDLQTQTQYFKYACVCRAFQIVETFGFSLTSIAAYESALYTLSYSPDQIKKLFTGLELDKLDKLDNIIKNFIFNGYAWGNLQMIKLANDYGFTYPNPSELLELVLALPYHKSDIKPQVIKTLLSQYKELGTPNELTKEIFTRSILTKNKLVCTALNEFMPELYKLVEWKKIKDPECIDFYIQNIPQTHTWENLLANFVINTLNSKNYLRLDLYKDMYSHAHQVILPELFDRYRQEKNFTYVDRLIELCDISQYKNLTQATRKSNYVCWSYLTKNKNLNENFLYEFNQLVSQSDSLELIPRIISNIFSHHNIHKQIFNQMEDNLTECIKRSYLEKKDFKIFDICIELYESKINFRYLTIQIILDYLNYKLAGSADQELNLPNNTIRKIFELAYSESARTIRYSCDQIINIILCSNKKKICENMIEQGIISAYQNDAYGIVETLLLHVNSKKIDQTICNVLKKFGTLYSSYPKIFAQVYGHISNVTNFDITYQSHYIFKFATKNNHDFAKCLCHVFPTKYSYIMIDSGWGHYENQFTIVEEIKPKNISSKLVENCPICLDTKANIITQCSHQFCSECLTQCKPGICPLCRQISYPYYTINEIPSDNCLIV